MKHYVKTENTWDDEIWQAYLEVNENDIEEKLNTEGLAYVEKGKESNIGAWVKEYEDFERSGIDVGEIEDYTFVRMEDLSAEEKDYLTNGTIGGKEVTEQGRIEFATLMIGKQRKSLNLETYKAVQIIKNNNWEEIILEDPSYSEWTDYSEEFKDMEEIDYEKYDTGHYTLYKLINDSLILIDTSYYEGEMKRVYFVESKYKKTVDEVLEESREKID